MTATILLNSQVGYPPFFPFHYHSPVLHRTPFTVCTFLRKFIMCFLQCDHTYLFLSQSVPFPTTHFAIPYWSPPSVQIFGSSPTFPLSSPTQDHTPHKSGHPEEPVLSLVHCHCPLLLQAALWFYRRMATTATGSQQFQRLLK